MITLLKNRHTGCLGLILGFIVLLSACNKGFDKVIPDGSHVDSATVAYGSPKVLYIIVDGARGQSVRDARTPFISSLLPKSIYSWVSLSDETVSQPGTAWTDLLTGVRKSKHHVDGNNFSANNLVAFPTIYKRIKETYPKSLLKVFTTSTVFRDNLTAGTDVSELLANDEAVKDKVVSSLSDEALTLVTGHFTSIDAAGAQNGYDLSVPAYKNAILKFDNYVGEMLQALAKRPNYAKENWMVVLASSRGGHFAIPAENNDNTIFSNPDVNTFTILYSNKYKTRFIGKPYLGNKYQGEFIRFNDHRKAQVTAGDNSVYNLGTAEFTIELKVKKNKGPNDNYKFYYPSILGKRAEWTSGWPGNGWVIFLEDNYWMFNAKGPGGGDQVKGTVLADATWNSVAVVGVIRENKRYVRTFTNGAFNNERDISGWGNMDNSALLTLGYLAGTGHREPDVYLSDVRIWKAALPDSVINRFACDTYVDPGHPYYQYLAGYWPVVGNNSNTILDEGPLGSHMTFSGGDSSWDKLSEYICAPSQDNLGTLVPRSVDAAAQIISWLKVPRQESWQLDGRVWLDQ